MGDRIVATVRALRALAHNAGPPCLDFADVRLVLRYRAGPLRAHVGEGVATGPDHARRAVDAALADLRRHVGARRPAPPCHRDRRTRRARRPARGGVIPAAARA
jgi:hypothetical protein